MKVEWDASVPAEVKRTAAPLFKRHAKVAPTWCHWLTVQYGPIDGDGTMECDARPEYRQASIKIGEGWLAESADARSEDVCHEHVHILLAPMANFFDRIMQHMPDDVGKAVLQQEWEHAVEGVTCDIARLLHDDG